MRYTIPFTKESVKKEICGRTMCLGTKLVAGHQVYPKKEIVLLSVPGDNGIPWRVENGALVLTDTQDSVTHCLDAIQIAGESTLFLSGDPLRETSTKGSTRAVMYEKNSLGTAFQIVISSHVDYQELTLPRLLRSLAREGVPADRITVALGGKEGDSEVKDGILYMPVESTALAGCAALVPLLAGTLEPTMPYVLLMHDTCEAASGFGDAIKKVDVGLPFDLIQGTMEIGLWSSEFLKLLRDMPGLDLKKMSTSKIFSSIHELCRLSRNCPKPHLWGTKDVYGSGIKRQVYELEELGIKKYRASDTTGGRP